MYLFDKFVIICNEVLWKNIKGSVPHIWVKNKFPLKIYIKKIIVLLNQIVHHRGIKYMNSMHIKAFLFFFSLKKVKYININIIKLNELNCSIVL